MIPLYIAESFGEASPQWLTYGLAYWVVGQMKSFIFIMAIVVGVSHAHSNRAITSIRTIFLGLHLVCRLSGVA